MNIRIVIKYIKYIISLYFSILIYKLFYKNKDDSRIICLGSNGKVVDENTTELFKYLQGKEETYFILDKDSPVKNNIKQIGRVLDRLSFRANLMVLRSKTIFYDTSYLDLIRCNESVVKHLNKVNVSHGLLAFKKKEIEDTNRRVRLDDFVIATSNFEKSIKEEWGFNTNQIILSGLPRFDTLNHYLENFEPNKTIFYMPTWRPWFHRSSLSLNEKYINEFTTSVYFNTINDLFKSKALNDLLEREGYVLEVYIHKIMHNYIREINFNNKFQNIKILDENVKIQEKIISSEFLITDYSSIIFDFLYLKKNVILYQFDDTKYYNYVEGSYINKNDINDLIVKNIDDLITSIELTIKNKSLRKQEIDLREKHIKYFDNKNCERLHELTKVNSI